MSGIENCASEAVSEPNFDLVFVTAAQFPSVEGLHASQVLEPAIYMIKRGYAVTWIAAVSMLSYLNDVLLRKRKIQAVQNRCASEGIKFLYVVAPLPVNTLLSFLFRRPALGWAATRFLKLLNLQGDRRTIFHARSYFSAHLACEIRTKGKGPSTWRVSFDMRSVLPEEFALTQGLLGKACFGFAKQWEHELLGKSDVSFLPLNFARDRIQKESGHAVVYAPIQGFDRDSGWSLNFEQRWMTKYIGYAGSLDAWHDPALLLEILEAIPNTHPKLAMSPGSELAGLERRTYKQHEMAAYYDSLLALAIPGRKDFEDYFVSIKMRCNFFSTKAAEALSRGVPLIVSAQLTELADFVEENNCGAIFDPATHQIVYPAGDWLTNRNEWLRLTKNAQRAGEMFTRSYAMDLYQSKWNSLFDVQTSTHVS